MQLLERQIRTLRFNGLISLHADDDSLGLYAFALGAQVTQHVVEPALAAAEKVLPRNCDPTIDNFVAQNGLIRRGYPGMLCAEPEAHPQPFEIVFETPRQADLEKQIAANLVFLRHALDQYQQLQAVGPGPVRQTFPALLHLFDQRIGHLRRRPRDPHSGCFQRLDLAFRRALAARRQSRPHGPSGVPGEPSHPR